jgi:hypothetical protein
VLNNANLRRFGWHRRLGWSSEKGYLSKSALPHTSEEDKVEEIDIGIKVDDLREDY